MISKFFIFLFLISFSLKAQKLQGTVSDESGTVSGVMVVIKKTAQPNLIFKFTTTNLKGQYEFEFEKEQDSLSVQAIGYLLESEIHKINFLSIKNKAIITNLFLKNKNIELREVTINSKRPITIKNDTVNYNPSAFRDGSERVIEDLLKKLPGIEVKQSGQILYKGKPIKKFLLEGDDLFASQYIIGSRNIDVNMIEKVQAIDKFSENPLLKGLVDSEDVAINFQLVKGKSDFSGTANLGFGIKDRYETTLTALLINSKNKGFTVSGNNNLGQNSSPYDFQSSIGLTEISDDNIFTPKKIINEGNFFSQLDSKYYNINSNSYTSVNFLRKISKKTTIKVNAGFYEDHLKRDNKFTSTYMLNNQNLVIENIENLSKKPKLYDLNIFVERKKSKSVTWDFSSKFIYQLTDFTSTSYNNNTVQNSIVTSNSLFTKQVFNLTKRIDSISALKIFAIYTNGHSPQNFILSPGFNTDEKQTDVSIIQNQQESNFTKEILKLRFDYFKIFHFFNWNAAVDYNFVKNHYSSSLIQTSINLDEFKGLEFQNNNYFAYHLPSLFSSFIKEIKKKYAIGFSIRSNYYVFNLEDKFRADKQSNSKLIFAPVFKYIKFINNYSKITFSYKYNAIAPSEENLFKGIVLTGFRSFLNNEPNFAFINTHSYSLEYDYNNIFKFNRLTIRISHDNRENNYFSKSAVKIENTLNTMFFLPTSRLDYRIDLNAEQFVYFLRTYFKFYGSYGVGFDKNVVNNSDLRNVQNRNLNLILNITPKITNNIQFENKTNFTSNEFYVESKKSNGFESIENKSTISYNFKSRYRAKTTFNYMQPNLKYPDYYMFWDFEIEWTPTNSKIKYALLGHNLLNFETFNSIFVNDFSKTQFSYTLLKRYAFLKIYFNF